MDGVFWFRPDRPTSGRRAARGRPHPPAVTNAARRVSSRACRPPGGRGVIVATRSQRIHTVRSRRWVPARGRPRGRSCRRGRTSSRARTIEEGVPSRPGPGLDNESAPDPKSVPHDDDPSIRYGPESRRRRRGRRIWAAEVLEGRAVSQAPPRSQGDHISDSAADMGSYAMPSRRRMPTPTPPAV